MPANPNVSVAVVTPAIAAVWLTRNSKGQRPLDEAVVDRYAADMREGRWILTHTPIYFADDGRLINGQHRLRAVIVSNTTQRFVVLESRRQWYERFYSETAWCGEVARQYEAGNRSSPTTPERHAA